MAGGAPGDHQENDQQQHAGQDDEQRGRIDRRKQCKGWIEQVQRIAGGCVVPRGDIIPNTVPGHNGTVDCTIEQTAVAEGKADTGAVAGHDNLAVHHKAKKSVLTCGIDGGKQLVQIQVDDNAAFIVGEGQHIQGGKHSQVMVCFFTQGGGPGHRVHLRPGVHHFFHQLIVLCAQIETRGLDGRIPARYDVYGVEQEIVAHQLRDGKPCVIEHVEGCVRAKIDHLLDVGIAQNGIHRLPCGGELVFQRHIILKQQGGLLIGNLLVEGMIGIEQNTAAAQKDHGGGQGEDGKPYAPEEGAGA